MDELSKIVAGGREHLLDSPEMRRQVDEVYRKVNQKYEQEMAQAGLMKRTSLRWKIRREINQELEKIAPTCGFY